MVADMMPEIIRSILLTRRCVSCGSRDLAGAVCNACQARVVLNQTLFCGACRARLPSGKKICHSDFPYLLGAATDYEDPVTRELIHALKFRRFRAAAAPLASILAKYLTCLPIDFRSFPILPVPLSKRRMRERGFNQSDLIAEEITVHCNMSMTTNLLIRTRHTKPQSEAKDVGKRRINLSGAFIVRPDAIVPPRIILLDDVTTSGATFLAATQALKGAGVRQIIALAVAKA